jgi:hypothetical protein
VPFVANSAAKVHLQPNRSNAYLSAGDSSLSLTEVIAH